MISLCYIIIPFDWQTFGKTSIIVFIIRDRQVLSHKSVPTDKKSVIRRDGQRFCVNGRIFVHSIHFSHYSESIWSVLCPLKNTFQQNWLALLTRFALHIYFCTERRSHSFNWQLAEIFVQFWCKSHSNFSTSPLILNLNPVLESIEYPNDSNLFAIYFLRQIINFIFKCERSLSWISIGFVSTLTHFTLISRVLMHTVWESLSETKEMPEMGYHLSVVWITNNNLMRNSRRH